MSLIYDCKLKIKENIYNYSVFPTFEVVLKYKPKNSLFYKSKVIEKIDYCNDEPIEDQVVDILGRLYKMSKEDLKEFCMEIIFEEEMESIQEQFKKSRIHTYKRAIKNKHGEFEVDIL